MAKISAVYEVVDYALSFMIILLYVLQWFIDFSSRQRVVYNSIFLAFIGLALLWLAYVSYYKNVSLLGLRPKHFKREETGEIVGMILFVIALVALIMAARMII